MYCQQKSKLHTCAPKYASSAASSKVKCGTGLAAGWIFGSHVNTPSTSFHTCLGKQNYHQRNKWRTEFDCASQQEKGKGKGTCISRKPKALPIVVAVKSLPPLPRVVMAPNFHP